MGDESRLETLGRPMCTAVCPRGLHLASLAAARFDSHPRRP